MTSKHTTGDMKKNCKHSMKYKIGEYELQGGTRKWIFVCLDCEKLFKVKPWYQSRNYQTYISG